MLRQVLAGTTLQKATHARKRQAEGLFCAPEQLAEDIPIDARTDLYALGVIAYMRITSNPPFTGISANEIFTKIAEGNVVEPIVMMYDTKPQ